MIHDFIRTQSNEPLKSMHHIELHLILLTLCISTDIISIFDLLFWTSSFKLLDMTFNTGLAHIRMCLI